MSSSTKATKATKRTTAKAKTKTNHSEPTFLDFCALAPDQVRQLAYGSAKERRAARLSIDKVTREQVTSPQPLTWREEAACVLFLALGVPNGVFTIPLLTWLIGYFIVGNVQLTFLVLLICVLVPLAILPQPFVPSRLTGWMALTLSRYFSFRFILEQEFPELVDSKMSQKHPQICVAPPHGVFPYGNLLAMIIWPSLTGHHFHGLAASSALRVPLFKQILRGLGVIDASRDTARRALERYPYTIGISTGGVAEVFETSAENECVLLKERLGLIKLAIRTGADLIPCYLFGNTQLLSCWSGQGIPGGRTLLEFVSRKVGFALILIFGRWGLPIPRRVPVLAVAGKPIATHHLKCEEPTTEQLLEIQALLLDEMQDIFERYKGLYGWDDKQLIIK